MTEQTEGADPYVPDADDETNLGLLIFEDATPGGTTKIIRQILASDWLAARIAAAEQRGREDNADHAMCYPHGSKALEALLAEAEVRGAARVLAAVEAAFTAPDSVGATATAFGLTLLRAARAAAGSGS